PRSLRFSSKRRAPWTSRSSAWIVPCRSPSSRSLIRRSSRRRYSCLYQSGSLASPPRSRIRAASCIIWEIVCLPLRRMMSSKARRSRSASVSPGNAGSTSVNIGTITSGQPWRISDKVPSKSNRTWLMPGRGLRLQVDSLGLEMERIDAQDPHAQPLVLGDVSLQPGGRDRGVSLFQEFAVIVSEERIDEAHLADRDPVRRGPRSPCAIENRKRVAAPGGLLDPLRNLDGTEWHGVKGLGHDRLAPDPGIVMLGPGASYRHHHRPEEHRQDLASTTAHGMTLLETLSFVRAGAHDPPARVCSTNRRTAPSSSLSASGTLPLA